MSEREGDEQHSATATVAGGRRRPVSVRDARAVVIKLLRKLRGPQDRLLGLLGSDPERREALVAGMLARNANEATSYWLQLVVSVGIATLGLVVGSVAVIIGAMLVAPLMGPIIALAMGLATGSPFLVLRSAGRIALSVSVAIGGAAVITLLLPFHELNSEIAGRTSPTVLDLVTAGFCALAGVYASLRPGSDTATTAAGTSIGISLVPPLCASGYGFGTTAWAVAGGAALLFLTNLVAIIFVGSISFLAAGFNRVNSIRLERDELARNQDAFVTAAVARRLAGLFESRAGPMLRFLMPFVLLAAVYVPLRSALDEVAWQVRVRAAVRDSLAREKHQVVQSRVRVERHEVDVLVVLVGKTADAEASRKRLDAELREASGVAPGVEVLAIPDAEAFAGLKAALGSSPNPLPLPPAQLLQSPTDRLDGARDQIRSSVAGLWPAAAAGEPLAVELGTAEEGPLVVRVVYLGPALGADASESLGKGLTDALDREVRLVAVPIPSEPLARADSDVDFVSRVAWGIRASAEIPAVSVCVTEPREPPARGRARDRDRELAGALHELLARHPRVTRQPGDGWTVRFVRGSCPVPAAADAGTEAPAPKK